MSEASPIIAQSGKMGRIRPGTRLAVRAATDDELAHERERLARIDCGDIEPHLWFVVWADEPSQVLKDWFVPVGGPDRECALREAHRYAAARGAVVEGG